MQSVDRCLRIGDRILLLTLDENYLLPCKVMLYSFFTSNHGEKDVFNCVDEHEKNLTMRRLYEK